MRIGSPWFILGPAALSSLQGVCTDFNSNNYVYHICPFRYIAQVENWEGGYRGIIGLGLLGFVIPSIWGHFLTDPYQREKVSTVFDDGDWCSDSIDRRTEVSAVGDRYT